MDPSYQDRKVVDLSDEELRTFSFLGKDIAPDVRTIVNKIKAHPENLGSVTCFMIDCLNRRSLAPPSLEDDVVAPTRSRISNEEARAIVPPELISKFEKKYWYRGISSNPPELLWRSDFETNPFPMIPPRGAHFFRIPEKTVHGVFNTPLNAVWDTVAPQIIASMKERGLKYSALMTARFSFVKDSEETETFGPVVVWIAVRPNTTTAAAVRDATPAILQILADYQITDAVVEWYEGSVERLDRGPPLMGIEDYSSPMFGLNHPFNTGLGIPIARESDDAQGTLTFLFREVKTRNGDPSDRILAVTTKHVASADTSTDYEFDGADPQHILVCGERRLARAVVEIEDAIYKGLVSAVRLSGELADWDLQPAGVRKDSVALGRTQTALDTKNEANTTRQTLLAEVQAQWRDTHGRRLGAVDWAPAISVSVDEHRYTRDIATFTVDGSKLENFQGNIVDLGNQYSSYELEKLFWPNAALRNAEGRTIPPRLQLPIHRALPPHRAHTPDTHDTHGEPLYIVAKHGNTSNLTLGRLAGSEAYICTRAGLESREMAVYNHAPRAGDFAEGGDSGALIFGGGGEGVAVLHSGMPRGVGREVGSHVAFGTPLWWVMEQVRERYAFAEFCGIAYAGD